MVIRRVLSTATATLSLLAMVAAIVIILVGGFQGTVFGHALSARSADRPLTLFSVLFLLRAWWLPGSIERRCLRAVVARWAVPRDGGGRAGFRSGAGAVLATAATWAALGGALGLSEGAGLVAGHHYLFSAASSAVLLLAASALLHAAASAAVSPAALLVTALLHPRDRRSEGGPDAPRAGRPTEVAVGAVALVPLVATMTLAGHRALWSLPPGGPGAALAGAARLSAFLVGAALFGWLLPRLFQSALRRPLLGLGALGVVAAVVIVPWAGVSLGRGAAPVVSKAGGEGEGAGDEAGRRAPNVLLVTIDTLRADRLGCYGNERVATPAMDRLAASGVRFEQAFCQIPETGPAHASMLNGRYPLSHGSRANGQPPADFPALPSLLRERGYRTAAFVSGYTLKSRLCGLDRGFDLYDEEFSRFETLPGLTLLSRMEDWGLLSYVELWKVWAERRADRTNRAVIRWLRETAGEESPFFLWVHYFDPHGPYDPPGRFDRLYYEGDEKDPSNTSMKGIVIPHRHQQKPGVTDIGFYVAQYDAEVAWTDSQVERLLGSLEEMGLAGRTLVLLTSDHGESLTEHDYYFAHGGDLFDPSVRVPLIIAGPDIPPGRVVRSQVQGIDLAPSLLDLLGVPVPEGMEGRSLARALRGEERGDGGGPAVFLEGEITRERRGKAYEDPVAGKQTAIRADGFKLVRTPGFGDSLFDLAEDPGETTDVSHFRPEIATRFGQRLEEWMSRAAGGSPSRRLPEQDRRLLESLGYVDR